jgi:uncharacterized protein YjhX (UPF0386 family)
VDGTGVYYAGVGPKGSALERFPNIKKKKLSMSTAGYPYTHTMSFARYKVKVQSASEEKVQLSH